MEIGIQRLLSINEKFALRISESKRDNRATIETRKFRKSSTCFFYRL